LAKLRVVEYSHARRDKIQFLLPYFFLDELGSFRVGETILFSKDPNKIRVV
jgi:hypothetical protein